MSADAPFPVDGDTGATAEEAALAQVLESYFAQLEAGAPADPERLIAAHPELAGLLRACLKVMHLAQGFDDSTGRGPLVYPHPKPSPSQSDPDPNRDADTTPVITPPLSSSVLMAIWPGDVLRPTLLLPEPAEDGDPPIDSTHPNALAANPGSAIGRYQFVRVLDRGGMGVVLEVRDAELGRNLALKVLRKRYCNDPGMIRRFVEEAQIGAQLQHPNIVPVHEKGTLADGRPYFTMKLVEGRTLATLLAKREDRLGRGSHDPHTRQTEGLTPTHDVLHRFLSIFETVCQTVAYAHARGVINRDLKPGNVMVGSFGEVQVMDWGLAKLLPERGIAGPAKAKRADEPTIQTVRSGRGGSDGDTQPGGALGTLAYMAPEQARGDLGLIDERSDVFSLGAIVCEMLTGRPPFTGSTRTEILEMAKRGDLDDALDRLDACGADAELIALAKDCLATERERRPRHAGEVARRFTDYQAGVQERLQAAELARVEAQTRAQEAQARATIERSRRRRTVALAAAVVALLTVGSGGAAMYFQQRRDQDSRLGLALNEVDFLRGQALADPEGDPVKWQLVVSAVKRAEDLLGRLIDATTQRRVRELSRQVASAAASAERDAHLIRETVDIRSAEADDPDGSARDTAYAVAFRDAGIDVDALAPEVAAAKIQARPRGVAVALVAALDDWAIFRRAARPRDTDGWKRLVAMARGADPDETRDRLRQLWSEGDRRAQREPLLKLAREADTRGWPPTSLTLLAAGLDAAGERQAAVDLLGRAQADHPGDVWINYDLAKLLEQLHPPRTEEAIRFYSVARGLRPETGHGLAIALEDHGRGDEAVAVWRDLTRIRSEDGRNWDSLGKLLGQRGDRAGAEKALAKAVYLLREAIQLRPDFAAHNDLGVALSHQGKLDEAIAEYREAIRLKPNFAETHSNLGLALSDQGKLDGAIVEYREAIRLKPDYAESHTNLGLALSNQGTLAEAIVAHREAIRLMPDLPNAHNNLGLALRQQGKLAEAITEYREAIRLKPDYDKAHNNLGNALSGQGKLDEAIAEFREAIRLKPDSAEAHCNIGATLRDQRKLDEAIAEFREAIRLKPDLAGAHYNLGNALRDQGKFEEAIAEFREAIRLNPDFAEAHCNLGQGLQRQGQFREGLAELRRGHELGSRRKGWPYPSAEWVRQAERMVALESRLHAVNCGDDKPKDAAEGIELAHLAYNIKHFGLSARLCATAFQIDPELATKSGNRYNAARAAALAAAGKGNDKPPLNEREKTRWRKQAIDWLKADLAFWAGQVEADKPGVRSTVTRTLQHWKINADLAVIRDPDDLATLPEDEQKACRALWAELDALLTKTRAATKR
jgi:serine/threonine-protein kinase